MFSPRYMLQHRQVQTIEPPLKFASDLYYLEYYRYWAVDRSYQGADPAGGSAVPAPSNIVIRSIHEGTISRYFRAFKEEENDGSDRTGGKKWPGDKYVRDDDEFNILMTSPMGQGVTWFLAQHKHIFGAKSVSRIRVWASSNAEDDYNMLFEIRDPPEPEEDDEQVAGPDPPAERRRRALSKRGVTTVSSSIRLRTTPLETRLRRHHLRRVRRIGAGLQRRIEDESTWNSWLCTGRAMYDLMSAYDDAAAEAITQKNPLLVKWRGRTVTTWHDPNALAKYGWRIDSQPLADLDDVDIDDSVSGSTLPTDDPDDWTELQSKHVSAWKPEGGGGQDNKVCEFRLTVPES